MQVSISSKTIPQDMTWREQKPSPPPPGQSLCTKTSPQDKTGSQKPHPQDIKLENFTYL